MAALAISLVEYNDATNQRTWTLAGHTVQKPRLVTQKRVAGSSETGKLANDIVDVVYGTSNSAGELLPGRIGFSVSAKRPVDAVSTDVDAALASFRAIVNSDEFAAMIVSQNYIK